MCGILGIYDQSPPEDFRETCHSLLQRIHYRGPDDEGLKYMRPDGTAWEGRGPGLFMGHKRLSIIDLSPSGRQPMSNEDKSLWIIFNGEIYNYVEIRKQLTALGHKFSSRTDTEVILHGYETWGYEVLERLRGMFAFCIYDCAHRRFFLARDRMGQKPLLYTRGSDFFAFSSELKAFYTYPKVKREVSSQSIHYFLTYQYIPHRDTIFKEIRKILPGHYAFFDLTTGKFRQRCYWRPHSHSSDSRPVSHRKYIEELQGLLEESIRLRLRSDVPLGVFLSGGLDSSTIAYFTTKLLSTPPNTFSISFEEQGFDESRYARLVSEKLQTNHHAMTVRSEGIKILPKLVWLYNEPFGDSSMIPTYYVSQVTAEKVTVALSGDGGDEVFLGYNRYLLYMTLKSLQNLFKILPIRVFKIVSKFLSYIPFLGRYPGMLYNFFSRIQSREYLDYAHYVVIANDRLKDDLYTPSFRAQTHPTHAMDLVGRLFKAASKRDIRQAFSSVDFKTYLPGDILTKVDIASMAHSLECRSPFLDHKVVEFACSLPPDEKLSLFKGKKILKQCMRGKLPNKILTRRKMGFGVPINRWFREEKWSGFLRDTLLSKTHLERGYFTREGIEGLIDEHVNGVRDRSAVLWQLLVLELWHETFLQETPGPLEIG